jgi:hypothetical protein
MKVHKECLVLNFIGLSRLEGTVSELMFPFMSDEFKVQERNPAGFYV